MRKAAILAGLRRMPEATAVARRALHASSVRDDMVFLTVFMERLAELGAPCG